MKNLANKRLLLLGGSLWKESIKDFADKQNITLIATGNDTSAGIFELADESYNVNSVDSDSMRKLLKNSNVDGIYMGGAEPVISKACEYINELGYPCYCTKEQWELLQNKIRFKQLLIENGLPVAPRYDINSLEDIDSKKDEIQYPVITKPTDGCGSNGFSVCHNIEELKQGYKRASETSASGDVIIEKFVKNDGVVVFYTFSDGKMYFSGLEDKYPVRYEEQGSYVAGMFIFESPSTEEFRKRFDDKLQKMFSSIGIKEGSLWIEVFYDGKDYYFNEAGYRYGGSVSIYPVDYLYGINQVAADIHYALTGKSKIFGHPSLIDSSKERKKYYCVYGLHLNVGTIKEIEGVSDILSMPNVIAFPITKAIGQKVLSTGSIAQVFAFVHFVFNDEQELKYTVENIHSIVKVSDEYDNNMLVRKIDFDNLNLRL